MSFFEPLMVAQPHNQIKLFTTTLTGTATEADVLAGKTFYNTDPLTLLTGTRYPPKGVVVYRDREVIKRVEVPTVKEKLALKLVGVLMAQKENMRRQNGE